MTRKFEAKTVEAYKNAAAYIVELMEDYNIFILKGNLGAGKTTLVQEVCKMIESEDVVTSPTFSLINPYLTKKGPVFHMDMYRINDAEEAVDFGIEEYLWADDQYSFIEWPDKIEILLPEQYVIIEIEQQLNATRNISISTINPSNK